MSIFFKSQNDLRASPQETYVDLYLRQIAERKALGEQFNGKIPMSERRKCKARQQKERQAAVLQLRRAQQDERDEKERSHGFDEIDSPSDNILKRENRPQKTPVHIRVQRRGMRRFITTVQNLSSDLDLEKINEELQRTLHVSSTVVFSEEFGFVIQLTGDTREGVKTFLTTHKICMPNLIIIH